MRNAKTMLAKAKETIMHILFLLCACASILAVVLICVYLFATGIPAMGEIGVTDFLFGMDWKPSSGRFGIFPMIIGSILVTGIAVLIGVPIGILCAVFMSHYCPKKVYAFMKPAVNLLAGIPSIVYGCLSCRLCARCSAARENPCSQRAFSLA